jgi:hypothetical protein
MKQLRQPPQELDVMNVGVSGNGRFAPEKCEPLEEIQQRDDPDGALRVTLIGDIDIAVADQLTARLRQLQRSERRVRLDLS